MEGSKTSEGRNQQGHSSEGIDADSPKLVDGEEVAFVGISTKSQKGFLKRYAGQNEREIDVETEAGVFKDKHEQTESKKGGAKVLIAEPAEKVREDENIHNGKDKGTKETKMSEGRMQQGHSYEGIDAVSSEMEDGEDHAFVRASTESEKGFLKRWFWKLFSKLIPWNGGYERSEMEVSDVSLFFEAQCRIPSTVFDAQGRIPSTVSESDIGSESTESGIRPLVNEWIKAPRNISGRGSQGGQDQGQGQGT